MTMKYLSEVAQEGRTAFWEDLRESSLVEHHNIKDSKSSWNLIGNIRKNRQLRRLESFVARATVIIGESREADRVLKDQQAVLETDQSEVA